jgi:hypothetical protein
MKASAFWAFKIGLLPYGAMTAFGSLEVECLLVSLEEVRDVLIRTFRLFCFRRD